MSANEFSLFDCPICLERYIEPKALPCLHSFCKSCIGEYIKTTNFGKDSTVEFDCPVCRQRIQLPSTDDPAEKLPNNFLIKSLSVTTEKLTGDTMICSIHKNKPVQFFCFEHLATVCPTCLLTDHRTCGVKEISEALDTQNRKFKEARTKRLVLKKKLEAKIMKLKTEKDDYRAHIKSCRDGIKIFIDQLCSLLFKAEAKLMREIEEEENKYIKSFDMELSDTKNVFAEVEKDIFDIIKEDNASQQLDQKCLNDFIRLMDLESKMRKYETSVACVRDKTENFQIHFNPNMDLFKILKLEHPLGEIKSKYLLSDVTKKRSEKDVLSLSGRKSRIQKYHLNKKENQSRTPSAQSKDYQRAALSLVTDNSVSQNKSTFADSSPSLDQDYSLDLRTQSDKRECFITGIAILDSYKVIVADHGNSKLKIFNEKGKIISEQVFSSEPWSVCYADQDGIAVSYPSDSLIQYFTIRKNRIFARAEKISTNGRCYGLAIHNDNQTAVCVRRVSGSFVSIYNDAYELCYEFQLSVYTRMSGIWYIAFTSNGKNIVFADEEHNMISSVDVKNGHTCWQKTVMKPRGLAVLGNTIYVASTSCTSVKTFSDLNGSPYNNDVDVGESGLSCIAVDRITGTIAISQMTGGKVYVHGVANCENV